MTNMLLTDAMETVLVSTSRRPTGHERIVLALRSGTDLYIPLDSDRPANKELLAAKQLYVRTTYDQDQCSVYTVADHRMISAAERKQLENHTAHSISISTEVVHLSGSHVTIEQLEDEPPGFVAVVDGSESTVRAIAPAAALADWYGRPFTIIAVTAGGDDADTSHAVTCQLEGTRLSMDCVVPVAKVDLDGLLFDLMRQGQIVVASAFGVWNLDGRLHGMLNGLVQHNAPAIIGIGPNVPSDWQPHADEPIVVCVDDTEHAHHLVAKLEPFLVPARGRVVVVHVETHDNTHSAIARDVADEIQQRFGIPVRAETIADESVAAGIAIYASRMKSQLVITHSWHRKAVGGPAASSTSLTSVAHVPCPVVILGE